MQVKVNYLSVVSITTGKKEEYLQLDEGTTIAKLLSLLTEEYGPRFRDMIYMRSKDRKYLVRFMVNGTEVHDTYQLKNDDVLIILLALGGG